MVIISKDLPAGNIRFVSQTGNTILLEEEQRDTRREWFYWKFKAVFDESGEYTFRFTRPWKVGTRSVAVSYDRGISWQWLARTMYEETQEFRFTCTKPGEVWFCQGIPYLQGEFDAFAAEFKDHPAFHLSTLCKSRKGRDVELATIREGEPERAILLTSRHHCQEMAATHVLEGVLRAMLSNDESWRNFRRKYTVYVVPFVDKDGVEDGDQGKDRAPRDHGRDYHGESIYPETKSIRELIETKKPFLVLDFHCPWLRSGASNEEPYVVENSVSRFQAEGARIAALIEQEAPECAPFAVRNTIRWGVAWNCNANAGTGTAYGKGIGAGCAGYDFVRFSSTMEIPFANFGEHTMTRFELLQFGQAVARALSRYAGECFEPQENRATLCFTGDIMCKKELTAACTVPNGTPDYGDVLRRVAPYLKASDLCIGNLETVFAGVEAGYSSDLYSFNTQDEFAKAVRDAGIGLVSTANNHCLDRGIEGLFRTLRILDENGIEHTGTFRMQEEHDKPLIRYVGGMRIGFVSCTYGTNAFANRTFLKPEESFAVNLSQPQETLPGSVHLLNSMEKIAQDTASLPDGESAEFAALKHAIERTRNAGAEYIIVLMHSGGQYNAQPDAFTEKTVSALLSCGADMIVGNHPHVIQKFAVKDGKPVFYCLGNMISTRDGNPHEQANPQHLNSAAVKPVLARKNGKIEFAGGTFSILRSMNLPDGMTLVVPLYELMTAETDPVKKEFYAEELRRSVRAFLDLPETAPVELKAEYEIC